MHPAAEILPLAAGEEFEVMQTDIAVGGIIEPIKVDSDNLLVDGRNRLRVAWVLGLKSIPIERINPKDVLAYVISENIARRHLTVGQWE
jgi:ParB-like chromosome segregation protein Spo0J